MDMEQRHEMNGPQREPAGRPVGQPSWSARHPRRKLAVVFATLVIVLVIGIGWSWWLFGRNTAFNENSNIDPKGYQAVFLTNGQVYFGKLAALNHKYVTITNIYYLQVQSNTGLQGSSSSGESSNSQVSLAKLGNELHGPKDKMYIASGQMLFWENLKDDSKVVQAIDKYQAQQQQ